MTVIVIDDDPTGAQTLRDVPLLFGIDRHEIERRLDSPDATVCVLTNSRSLSETEAAEANRSIARLMHSAGEPPLVVSRGDSTLRGNLKAETEALVDELWPEDEVARVFVPAFIEAGRRTRGGVHYVESHGTEAPVGETPFARDTRFGFASSRLADYLVEIGAVASPDEVIELSLDEVRLGPERIAQAIASAPGRWLVPDAVTGSDIDAIAAAIRQRHDAGQPVLVRCAPSLVRALAGQRIRPRLTARELRELFPGRTGHGLVVVGSHVPQTTRQLAALADDESLAKIEFSPYDIDLNGEKNAYDDGLVSRIVDQLATKDVVLSTPREEVRDHSHDGSVARDFSRALSSIVAAVAHAARPAWVIAKGGITSHDTAEIALGIKAAEVVGQLFDSRVSIVRPDRAPEHVIGMPYVIFPGNVGEDEDLARAISTMRALSDDRASEENEASRDDEEECRA